MSRWLDLIQLIDVSQRTMGTSPSVAAIASANDLAAVELNGWRMIFLRGKELMSRPCYSMPDLFITRIVLRP
jgi:hypothetical protein